jgi:tetratricopeptide (TPR) repeat protein
MEKIGKKLKAHERDLAKEQELEYEEVSGPESISDFVSKYRNLLIGGVAVILLLIIGGFVFRYFQGTKNAEAGEKAFNAVYDFERGSYAQALEGDSTGAYPGLLSIVADYDGTDEGNMAKYYAGVSYLNLGNAAEAINMLDDVSTGDNAFSVAAKIALGCAHEEAGDYSSAADAFESAAYALSSNKDITPFALFHAGLNYEKMGNKSKALSIYQDIKEDYPSSSEATSIDKYIARVSP